MMTIPTHDPYDPAYRSPGGAVPSGARVTLRIRTPRNYEVAQAVLCADWEQESRPEELPMEKRPAENAKTEYDEFAAVLDTAAYRGLIFYHFRLSREGGLPYYYGPMRPTPEHPDVTGGMYNEDPPAFQITVYDPGYTTPDWFADGVTYQIFPDRFQRSRVPDGRDFVPPRRVHADWADTPEYRPGADGKIRNDDFFGGDLAGIRDKLPYIASLGVRAIYLNPIFEAASNHRYDTGDYTRVDPMLGTREDFAALCRDAAALGIRVILDGVFSHTGSDSVYFNAQGHYPGAGAAQSRESPYADWYDFESWPDKYACWWGVPTLPAARKLAPSYLSFITGDPDSVVRRWLRDGASGWRLDVADELPEVFVERVRAAARREKPDALVLGEVWEDASNKVSYGVRRGHLWGRALDGVMNYPLRQAILDFLGGGDALYFADSMRALIANCPPPALRCMMNLVGTHDTPRILTLLGSGRDAPSDRDARATYTLSPAQYAYGRALLRLASAIQFCFPGSPCVYYGDEAGAQGFEDPFNRRGYPWGREDAGLLRWYRRLGKLRCAQRAFREGKLRFLAFRGGVLALSREAQGETVLLAVNRDAPAVTVTLPWTRPSARDLLSGEELTPEGGLLSLSLPAVGLRLVGG